MSPGRTAETDQPGTPKLRAGGRPAPMVATAPGTRRSSGSSSSRWASALARFNADEVAVAFGSGTWRASR